LKTEFAAEERPKFDGPHGAQLMINEAREIRSRINPTNSVGPE